jgi:hypothetical protein
MDDVSFAPLLALGLWHGVNPGMGWLFAVALGMQEGKGRAVWRALPPLAAGHLLAVAGAVALAAAAGVVLPPEVMEWVVAAALALFAVDRLVRGRHPRYGGMKVGPRQLATWSLLMATVHGAGLMVVPFALAVRVAPASHHAAHVAGLGASAGQAVAAALIHTTGYLLVTGLVALVVYHKVGLGLLRRAWVNLDLVWAAALFATAVLTVV